MAWKNSMFLLFILLLFTLAGCTESESSKEKTEEGNELTVDREMEKEHETKLTEIPVFVGAEPRCCVGKKIIKAEVQTNPDLLIMDIELRNQLGEDFDDRTLYIGYEDMIPVFNLLTDQGVYNSYLHEPDVLLENEKKVYKLIFPDVKGNVLGLTVRRIFEEGQIQDGSYRESDSQGSHAFIGEITDERMKQIGRDMYTKIADLELLNSEAEAREVLDYVFNREYPEIYSVILEELTYGEYSDFDIAFSEEQVEFKDTGARIQYEADVEFTFYDQKGNTIGPRGFGINSFISISPETGDYFFESLDYDYLHGTDAF